MPWGRVRYCVFRKAEVIEQVDESNLVVTLASSIMANAIGGAAAGGVVSTFGIGTNLLAPASGNTVLTGSFTKPLDGVSYPAPSQVSFAFSLASGEANGINIGELGLLTGNGLLFARKVRQAGLPKDSTVSLSGTWTITW